MMKSKKANSKLSVSNKEDRLIRYQKTSSFSKGEMRVANFLKSNQVYFYKNFFFKEFSVSGKLKLLFFDFYIPSYNVCIEFDGEQHYTKEFNGKKLKNSESNDFLKSAFCKKNDIHLLRIKYTEIENTESIICSFFDKYL